MPKGQKKTKGTPELYNEVKKQVSLSLTPTAIVKLDELAKEHNLSRSEFVEQVARGLISPKRENKNSIPKEFVLYPTQSLLLKERNKLPEEMGSFLVSDLMDFAYIDSCQNLKKKFQNNTFIEQLKNIKEDSKQSNDYFIFWIKCDHPAKTDRTESELIHQFRSFNTYTYFFSSFKNMRPEIKFLRLNEFSQKIDVNNFISDIDIDNNDEDK